MRGFRLVVMMAFAAGCAVSVVLWRFWTSRCNESCPEWVALSMIGFIGIFPLMCSGMVVAVAAGQGTKRTKWALSTLFMAAIFTLIAMLTSVAK